MAKLSFPDVTAPEYPLKETFEDNLIKSSMENGVVKTRPRFTNVRRSFELEWSLLDNDSKDALEQFFLTKTKCGSLPFKWLHPHSEKSYSVRFSEPPAFNLKMKDYWQVSVKLQEV